MTSTRGRAAGILLLTALTALHALAQANASLNFNVKVYSQSENALIDGLASITMTLAIVTALFLAINRPRILILIGIVVAAASLVLLSARSVVPVGAHLNETTMTVEYVYADNQYAKLYIVPIGFSILTIAVAVLQILTKMMTQL